VPQSRRSRETAAISTATTDWIDPIVREMYDVGLKGD